MPPFGELLKRLRGGRSQREIATQLGMPVTTLSTLENQPSIPRGATLKRLAEFYGVPMSYFYSAPTSELRSTDSARAWLSSIKKMTVEVKDGIATHAPPDVSETVKKAISAAINERKNAKTSDNE